MDYIIKGSIFDSSHEKGHREWKTYEVARNDKQTGFEAHSPRRQQEPRYPNTVPIKRYRTA